VKKPPFLWVSTQIHKMTDPPQHNSEAILAVRLLVYFT
jgi:hypothetical protein